MSWTYSGNPSSTPLDKVRFLIGDTQEDDPLLQDDEIKAILADISNEYLAAAMCCDILATKFAPKTDKKIGPMEIKQDTISTKFREAATQLRSLAKKKGSSFVGISGTDTNSQSIFYKDMMSDKRTVVPWTNNLKGF